MDDSGKQRDTCGRFKHGHAPLGGRPATPRHAITAALRRLIDPDEIARYLIDLATDEEAPHRERLAAAAMIRDRLEGKAISQIQLNAQVAAAPRLPPGWDSMSAGARREWLEQFRAKALAGGTLALAAAAHDDQEDA